MYFKGKFKLSLSFVIHYYVLLHIIMEWSGSGLILFWTVLSAASIKMQLLKANRGTQENLSLQVILLNLTFDDWNKKKKKTLTK